MPFFNGIGSKTPYVLDLYSLRLISGGTRDDLLIPHFSLSLSGITNIIILS